MAEMILPGTYIEVRAEGLIRPGPFSVGNIGIVGTAKRGRLADQGAVFTPANIGEARDMFGQSDAFDIPDDPGDPPQIELTLLRSLELAYASGANRVFAVRVAAADAVTASYTLGPLTLNAVAPGSGYNNVLLETSAGLTEGINVKFSIGALEETWRDVPAAALRVAQVINGTDPDYNFRSKSSTGGRSNLFTVEVDPEPAGDIANNLSVDTPESAGTDGPKATVPDYNRGLDALLNENVQIVVLAGTSATAELAAHVETASSDLMKRERIGVTGSDPSATLANLGSPGDQLEGRVIFVGPGLTVIDSVSGREVTLPGSYAAAAVAGRISSLNPHASPTNKTINARGVQTKFNGTQLEQLLLGRVLALESRNGSIRIVRGLTNSSNTAWQQITTRRIVDFAKFGTRAAANPFIGKLNNERVRQALKTSVNSLLADMIDREMLVAYGLEVSATRDEQIRGIAKVIMTLQPTFSIDFIRVVMFLQ